MAFFIPGIRALWASHRDRGAKPVDSNARYESAEQDSHVDGEDGPRPLAKRTARTYAREAAALVLIATGLYCALALASYKADPMRPDVVGANWVGPVGEVLARAGVGLVGAVCWLIPLELTLLARPLLIDKRIKFSIARLSGDIVIAVILAALIHIGFPEMTAFGAMPIGGAVGDLFGAVLGGLFSTVGSYLIGLTVVALILVERATFSFISVAQRMQGALSAIRGRLGQWAGALSKAWAKSRAVDERRRVERELAEEPEIASAEQADAIIAAFADDGGGSLPHFTPPPGPAVNMAHRAAVASFNGCAPLPEVGDVPRASNPAQPRHEESAAQAAAAPCDDDVPTPSPIMSVAEVAAEQAIEAPVVEDVGRVSAAAEEATRNSSASVLELVVEAQPAKPSKARKPKKKARVKRKRKEGEPKIVDTSDAARIAKAKRAEQAPKQSQYQLPGTDLLDPIIEDGDVHSPAQLKETAKLLEKTLQDYGVEGKVQKIHPGPTVTMYEVLPAPGTKVSKVASLADDLALGLSRKVRIIAPIPGKNRIGFEVPNEKRRPVSMRELIESEEFQGLDVPLPTVLGRDIIGRPFFADLASMPHVIVAGATGAGKSVGLNVMLLSLLYRRTPEQMRLLMIDPKVVELAPFDRIPHLLFPVVTDVKQAANALKWAVDEMERRYQLFADAGVRNIGTYNKYVLRVRSGSLPPPPSPAQVSAIAPDGSQLEIPACKDGSDAELPTKLPHFVIVIEEFADLMMTQGKDVEASVARLAQKARAAGLHVILTTQRPSVDVITGMIKANFPTRVAYRVTQKVDSRTILDQQGAEHLLGRGDMLVKMNGTNDVRRVQCPFASEDEVQRVTDMLRAQGEPDYDESIVRGREDDDAPADPGDAENDPLYDQAVRVVADTRKCSTSWIQRKLGIGYNRAAKIVETMEKNGLIGPPNGSKPREILISSH